MRSTFDYKEFKKWAENIGKTKQEFDIWLKYFLLEEAQRVVKKVKPRTPVDTGNLRNSWYIGSQNIVQKDKTDKNGNIEYSKKSGKAMQVIDEDKSDIASIAVVGNELQVEIGLSAEYASYVEYGHHAYQGRYMLTISIDEVQKQLPARFNKEWLKFIKERGVV